MRTQSAKGSAGCWARPGRDEVDLYELRHAAVDDPRLGDAVGGEHGGPWRPWRVDLEGGDRRYVSFPAHTEAAVPVGTKRVVVETCADDCRLLRDRQPR
jgi:hypothetical protein